MKMLIDGVIFDPNKAELIGDTGAHWIGTFDGGGLYIQKLLYRTKSGKFYVMRRCPKAPGFLNWLSTGGYSSDWEATRISKECAKAMIFRYGWSFKKAKVSEPEMA